jgi:hypothetical protein
MATKSSKAHATFDDTGTPERTAGLLSGLMSLYRGQRTEIIPHHIELILINLCTRRCIDTAWYRIIVACAVVTAVLLTINGFKIGIVSGTAAQNLGFRMERSWSSLKDIAGLGHSMTDSEAIPYPEEIPATALASFPRSGSSFTRSLVERATGLCSFSPSPVTTTLKTCILARSRVSIFLNLL